MKKKGFTLVELLAVIAILAILVIMALPAVLRMFNDARRDSFTNEVNTVIRTARQKYLLSGGTETTWTNAEGSTKSLDLTGNSNLRYYVKMDNEGKITKLQVSNGDFQYNVTNNNGIDVVFSSDVEIVTSENALVIVIPSVIEYVNRQNEGSITVGDEVAIDTEHFYVISTNATETQLFAKYNLYVGDIFDKTGGTWVKTKSLGYGDAGYGLQNENAKGQDNTDLDHRVVTVAFSGKGYWDNADCVFDPTSGAICPGTSGIKSEYGSYHSNPAPYVYRSSMSTVAPVYDYTYNSPMGYAIDNGYTIAYYVEEYVNRLKQLGAPASITGKLLGFDISVPASIRGNLSYWVGNTSVKEKVNGHSNGGGVIINFYYNGTLGVRPVIVVPTSAL